MGRLFWKFFLTFWLAILMAGIVVGTAVWLRHQVEISEQNPSAMQRSIVDDRHATALLGLAELAFQYGGVSELKRFLGQLHASHLPAVFAVDDQDQEILLRNPATETLQQARKLYLNGKGDAVRMLSAEDGHRYLLFLPSPGDRPNLPPHPEPGEPFSDDFAGPPPMPDEMGVIDDLGPDRQHRHAQGKPPLRPSPLLPILSGICASLLFSFALAWYFAKPIRRLHDAIAGLAAGNLQVRVADAMGQRRDELTDLGRDFDHMAEQIYRLIEAQQRLLHDVSHELRSPLARIQAVIGLIQQQPEKLPNCLARIEREAQRISDLVGELLVLSRLEAGVSGSAKQEFDLGGLLEDIIADARFEAEQRLVRIEAPMLPEIPVLAWGELLHRAIENVLRNAVQHCNPGGEVRIDMAFDQNSRFWRLCIEDQGPGVAESELATIFQPFFRSESSEKTNSIGLGLAIALRAVKAHAGHITAHNRPEGGLRVEIAICFAE